MKTVLIRLLFVSLFLASTWLHADVKIVYDSEKAGGSSRGFLRGRSDDGAAEGKAVVYFKADRARMEDPTGNLCPRDSMTIYRLDKGVMWVVQRNTKTYEEYRFEDMRKLPRLGDVKVNTEKTDETKVIKGHKCRKFVTKIKNPGSRMTITHTTWATDEIKTDEAMKEFTKKAIKELEGVSMLQGAFEYYQDLIDAGVFSVKTVTTSSFRGKGRETTTTLDSLSTDELEDSLFVVPKGYVKKPVMLGG